MGRTAHRREACRRCHTLIELSPDGSSLSLADFSPVSRRHDERTTPAGPRGAAERPRAVRHQSHRAGPPGQARPGHRSRQRDPARQSGAHPPHEEQSRAHRRARCRQDGGRRGPRPAHRRGRCRRVAQGQGARLARHLRPGRGRNVPRTVRGAPEERAQGDRRVRRADHHLHRRAARAHGRRRRRGVGRGLQHAQADARARRAAPDRRDDARRVPRVHREGCRARAPLPAGVRRRAERRRHGRDPARSQGALRGAPQGRDRRRSAGGRGIPVEPLHPEPAAARQGHRPHRRGRVAPAHGDRLGPARDR